MDSFMGEIRIFGFDYAPVDWALCDGAQMPVNQFQTLYSIIDNIYGGDQTNFNLPNLQGRSVWGAYLQSGQSPKLGQAAGTETVTLTQANMSAHSHTMNAVSSSVATDITGDPTGNWLSRLIQSGSSLTLFNAYTVYDSQKQLTALNQNSITTSGASQPHENCQPFLAMNFCISLNGQYPTRPS